MKMRTLAMLALIFAARELWGQFEVSPTVTDASLRGVSAAGPGVAWASGSGGTILRTEDGGYLWQRCTPPQGGEALDFRGVWGFDAKTVLVMASGTGKASGVWRSTDGCSTWTAVLKNPDAEGFFDAMTFVPGSTSRAARGYVWGDPVAGRFVLYETLDGGVTWVRSQASDLRVAAPGIGGFAASNSALLAEGPVFATSGPAGPFVYVGDRVCTLQNPHRDAAACTRDGMRYVAVKAPMAGQAASAGVFSLAVDGATMVAVGGDYKAPGESVGTAAYSTDRGRTWTAAQRSPRGYRSAVAYDANARAWLAVGPGGVDVSHDGGRTWQALEGETAAGWNAISLPYVVGAKGRIGKLVEGGLQEGR